MKRLNQVSFIFFLLVIMFSFSSCSLMMKGSSAGPVSIKIETSQKYYVGGQPIWLILSIENNSFDMLSLPGLEPGGANLSIFLNRIKEDGSLEPVDFHFSDETIQYPRQLLLDSYVTKYCNFNLLDYFGTRLDEPFSSCYYLIDKTGSYSVYIKYLFKYDGKDYEIKTKPVKFSIRQRTDSELSDFSNLELGRKLLAQGNTYSAIERFRNISGGRESSDAYSKLAEYYTAILLADANEDPVSYYKEFIEREPESYFSVKLLYALSTTMSQQESKEFYKKMLRIAPKSYIASVIRDEFGPFEEQ